MVDEKNIDIREHCSRSCIYQDKGRCWDEIAMSDDVNECDNFIFRLNIGNMKEDRVIKSYKGFDKNMQCRGFQYEVGKEYEVDGDIKCCSRGFHACGSPWEVFNYYDIVNSRFAEVEQSGKIDRGDNSTKVCSSRIKIKVELKLSDIIKICIKWLKNITSQSKTEKTTGPNDNSSFYVRISSSDDRAWISSDRDYAKISSSGNSANIGSSGNFAQVSSSGDFAKILSEGDYAQISSSDYYVQIGSSGYFAQISSTGYCARVCSSGNRAIINSSGDSTKIVSTGKDSIIMCAGDKSIVKAEVGSWITLTEWAWDDMMKQRVPKYVKTEYVDGERIKANTWYKLKDQMFTEVILEKE